MTDNNGATAPQNTQLRSAPVKATWIILLITWLLFIVPIPGLGLIGWAVNFAAFIMAIVVMTRGKVGAGVVQLVCTIIASPIVYFVGLAIFAQMVSTSLESANQNRSVVPRAETPGSPLQASENAPPRANTEGAQPQIPADALGQITIGDSVDRELSAHLDISNVGVTLLDGTGRARFEIQTRGPLLEEGNSSLQGTFYRIFADLERPYAQSIDFEDADVQWDVSVTQDYGYRISGPSLTSGLSRNANRMTFEVALGEVSPSGQLAVFADAVRFDSAGKPVEFDQASPMLIVLPDAQ